MDGRKVLQALGVVVLGAAVVALARVERPDEKWLFVLAVGMSDTR